MKIIRDILIGIFLLSSLALSIENKDVIGEWRISEDNSKRLSYPSILLESDSIVTLYYDLDTLGKGKFCTCDDELTFSSSEFNEGLEIVSFTDDTLVLSGFSHFIVHGDFKFKDNVTYIRNNSNKQNKK